MKPICSIIVPVYNAERYLNTCINSVLAQSFQDFELILVNDGSTDSSESICDEYAAKDNRIRVFHIANSGVSTARNIGLDNAKGKYIAFLDADDYWYDSTAIERLLVIAEKNDLDIIRGEYKAVDQSGNDLFEKPYTKCKKELSSTVISSGIFYTQILRGENFLFLSIFSARAIGNLRFNRRRSFLEDMEFYVQLLCQPLRCMFIPIRFYAYRKHLASASSARNIKNLVDSFAMCDVFHECFKKAHDVILLTAYKYNSIMMYYWTLETISLDPYYKDRLLIIKDLSLVSRQRQVSNWAKQEHSTFPIIVYLPPIWGVLIFRCTNKLKFFLVAIKKQIKLLVNFKIVGNTKL